LHRWSAYLAETAKTWIRSMQLYAAGDSTNGRRKRSTLLDAQLARGAAELRDLIALAWEDSLNAGRRLSARFRCATSSRESRSDGRKSYAVTVTGWNRAAYQRHALLYSDPRRRVYHGSPDDGRHDVIAENPARPAMHSMKSSSSMKSSHMMASPKPTHMMMGSPKPKSTTKPRA
jgi:hypothetical protein